ncbi:hypothetical protein [Cognatilysobacter bugurensis]|uniref:Uncharacterized protein n=1 Tax=Cognatilysobacter bugurensis TaxID=543356 RepID=A0A918SZI6_9GAMM|nr:hypothetical protein [Lysobacter bugurensis]GHA76770.1 hypothetical protein GCM10007067_12550 [Lysobacter bugurensis]
MKRPRSIILLILWFFWAAGRDLDSLARYSTTSDYYILSAAGLTWLFFAMAGAVMLLNAAGAYYLLRPASVGYPVLLSALGAGAAQNVVTVALAMRDLPGVRNAYEVGRELRGLPVRQEALDLIFTPNAMWTSLAISLVVYALIGWLVYRNRRLFIGTVGYAAEA